MHVISLSNYIMIMIITNAYFWHIHENMITHNFTTNKQTQLQLSCHDNYMHISADIKN